MKSNLYLLAYFGLLVSIMPSARADEWDQKTVFTFSAPVEIPGQVLLPGTYVFKLADSSSDRNIVQVFNKDESHLYGTFLAIADYRIKPSGKSRPCVRNSLRTRRCPPPPLRSPMSSQ
jgi:hypothetical protein